MILLQQYPECWTTYAECSSGLTNTITYTQGCGILVGALALGFAADKFGRRYGSIFTAGTMFLFGILMTASYGTTPSSLFAMFAAMQFLFGIGGGGEYPVASAFANERAESTKQLSDRRGETVINVLSMQGLGNLVNTLIILILMACFGQKSYPYNEKSLEIVWRLSYGLGLLPLAFLLYWRIVAVKESTVWQSKREAVKTIGPKPKYMVEDLPFQFPRSYDLLIQHYWHRNLGTAVSWFVWYFAFYGNKLFQATFIKVVNPDATLIEVLEWTCLNSFVALAGYYCAALAIDKPWMGRTRMQTMGFMWIGFTFLMCSMFYKDLSSKKLIHAFQFFYYFSTFWGSFGPNATTWLLPAELAPTEFRSTCHGFSSAVGQAGALIAVAVFPSVSSQEKFTICAACGFVGAVITWFFIPDLTGLDLREGDKRWLAIIDDKMDTYSGEAVNPKHLSLVERMLGYGKYYKAASDNFGDNATKALNAAGIIGATNSEEGLAPDALKEDIAEPSKTTVI